MKYITITNSESREVTKELWPIVIIVIRVMSD